MRQCYVCGDVITEPVSAHSRNLCLRCAKAPPERILESKPAPAKDENTALPSSPKPKPIRRPLPANQQSLRGTVCVAIGGILIAYSVMVILTGGMLHALVCGGGIALFIVGILDLYYWWVDSPR